MGFEASYAPLRDARLHFNTSKRRPTTRPLQPPLQRRTPQFPPEQHIADTYKLPLQPLLLLARESTETAARLPGPVAENNDGIVRYWSSHLDCALSECIVAGPHALVDYPKNLAELKRILHLHRKDIVGHRTRSCSDHPEIVSAIEENSAYAWKFTNCATLLR